MPTLGVYDADLVAVAWYDPTAVGDEGYWDFGMPYEHTLIDAPAAPAAGHQHFKVRRHPNFSKLVGKVA